MKLTTPPFGHPSLEGNLCLRKCENSPLRRGGFEADGVVKHKIRIAYKKVGIARFISHRNLMDCIAKALVAANIGLVFSEGFRSRPKISFGQPLPLGAIGENELFDVVVSGKNSVDLEKINSLLPQGIEFLEQKEVAMNENSIEMSVVLTNWEIEIINAEQGGFAVAPLNPFAGKLNTIVNEFLKKDKVEVATRKKEKDIIIEIIPSEIKNLTVSEQNSLQFSVAANCEGIMPQKIRPSDVVKAIFPQNQPSDFRIIRKNTVLK
jgi:radical SAM-linked protein